MSAELNGYQSWKIRILQIIMRLVINLSLRRKYKVTRYCHDSYKLPSGEEFVELTSQGPFNGKLSRAPEFHDKTFISMLRRFVKAINEYAKTQNGTTVYWRIKPEFTIGSTICYPETCPLQSTPEQQRQYYRDNFDCGPCKIPKKQKYDRYVSYTRLVIA